MLITVNRMIMVHNTIEQNNTLDVSVTTHSVKVTRQQKE